MIYSTKPAELLEILTATAYPEPESEVHKNITERVWREIVKPCVPAGGAVLDVGCGQGYAMELFASEGFEPIGIVGTVEDFAACAAKGLACNLMDMHDLGKMFWGNKFALVFMRHVLEHSPFPLLALWEARRVLKPGGWLYVETPAPDTACRHEENKNHYSVFGQRAWKALLAKAGFEVCREEQIEFRVAAGRDCYFAFLCRRPE